MAISCTLLACRRVPSDEPRERRSTWSKMEDEDRGSSGPLPEGTAGGRELYIKADSGSKQLLKMMMMMMKMMVRMIVIKMMMKMMMVMMKMMRMKIKERAHLASSFSAET